MKLTTSATLVVLTVTNTCDISNIDHAIPSVSQVDTMENCVAIAEQMDPSRNVRAFCIEVSE